ncbi:ATP synthase I [Salinisphaera shabanensis T35B1]|jgi:F0F1-type ATP synthase assembly protein I|uniref:ATP synthase I chain protein n=1 Tax=Salinisphaera shabanensis E1L3A TaxID=1033802 RepID=U2FRP7_9GAMM|nr:ATP synthase subunit I [Salinisphaera shabanensis]ERJ18749.1 ATP synthase I chain protein [Salinisphaera shabanensis E1L3A]
MRLAWAVLGAQVVTGFVMAAVFGATMGWESSAAALFGAVVAAVPGLWMALWMLPRRQQVDASTMARAFYWGELGKLGLTVGLFFTAALLFGQQFLVLLGTYVACLACYWLALILTR